MEMSFAPHVTVVGNTMRFKFGPKAYAILPEPKREASEMTDDQLREVLASLRISRRERRAVERKLAELRGKQPNMFLRTVEVAACLASVLLFVPTLAFAAPSSSFSVERAFSPLIELIRDIANPICYVMFIIGFIYVMIGRAHEGFRRMQYAAFGYIGVQMAPGLMKIIKQIGASMAV